MARPWLLIVILSVMPHTSNSSVLLQPSTSFVPSKVCFDEVSKKFRHTLQRRLFSSVPRREYALHNVSFSLNAELLLLTGASSSGKSTILKLISGEELPSQGRVDVSVDSSTLTAAKPIYLDERPSFDRRLTVKEIIEALLADFTENPSSTASVAIINSLFHLFHSGCDYNRWMDRKSVELSPSEGYRLQLVLASLQSMLGEFRNKRMDPLADAECGANGDPDQDQPVLVLPAPIILLDEWMDKETSLVIQTVQAGLSHLVRSGALVCSVTHKADRWKASGISRIVLCRGEILELDQGRT